MERGHNRALPVAQKLARATYSPGRDAGKVQIITPGDPPEMPAYLQRDDAAMDVWRETLPRVMATGVAEVDSSFLARYCMTEARCREILESGEMVTAAMMTMLRQHEELLGIAGPKSRIGRKPDGQSTNPFTRNGRR